MRPFNLHVEGNYFGDNDVLINNGDEGRDSTAIAVTDCQLLVISKKELNELLRKFPSVRKEMKAIALKRQQHHKKAISVVLTQSAEIANGERAKYDGEKEDPLIMNEFIRQNSQKKEGELIFE